MSTSLISVIRVLALRVLGVFISLLTVIGIAFHFGAGPVSDAYFLVRRIFGSLTTMIEGILTGILVPGFVDAAKGKDMKTYLAELHRRERIFLAGGAMLGLLVVFFSTPLVRLLAPGMTPEAVSAAALFFSMMALTLPVTFSTAFVGTALAAVRHFSAPVAVKLAPRVLILLAVLLVPLGFGLTAVVAAAVLGNLLMLPFVWLVRRRILQRVSETDHPERVAPPPRKGQSSQRAGALLVLSVYFIAATISESYVASLVGVGAIAILGLGQRISTLGISEMLSSLLSVYFTNFSERADQPAALNAEVREALRTGFFFVAPLSACLIALSQPIAQLVLAQGSFTQEAATQAGHLVGLFALAALVHTFTSILETAILAAPLERKIRFFMRTCFLALVARVTVMVVLLQPLGVNAIGTAAAVGPLTMVVLNLRYLCGYVGPILVAALMRDLAKVAVAGCTAALICTCVIWLTPEAAGKTVQAAALGAALVTAALGYITVTAVFGLKEARNILRRVRQILPGG